MALNVTVVGMGHLGATCASGYCLSGHVVRALETDPLRTAEYRSGRSPIAETELSEAISAALATNRLSVTDDLPPAIMSADVVVVATGTVAVPGNPADHTAVVEVYREIADVLKVKRKPTVILTATAVVPGTHERELRPILLRRVGDRLDDDVAVLAHPQFIRRGAAVRDWLAPPYVLFGGPIGRFRPLLQELYAEVRAPWLELGSTAAEMVKHAASAFQALKLSFANELGTLCTRLGVDDREVIRGIREDPIQALSARYLQPGFVYGGPALPRDVAVLCRLAEHQDLTLPLLQAIPESNHEHFERAWQYIEAQQPEGVGVVGLTFKAKTDDCRESPAVHLVAKMLDHGIPVRIYDPELPAEPLGANKLFLNRRIERLPQLRVERIDDAVSETDMVLVSHKVPGLGRLPELLSPQQKVYDLSGVLRDCLGRHPGYQCIAGARYESATTDFQASANRTPLRI